MQKSDEYMTLEEFHEWQKGQKGTKQSKFLNVKTEVDAITFDSGGESERYKELKLELLAGTITNLTLQPRVILQDRFYDELEKRWHREISYIPDFSYERDGILTYEDYKGMQTEAFKLKYKLFRYRYPANPLILSGKNKTSHKTSKKKGRKP